MIRVVRLAVVFLLAVSVAPIDEAAAQDPAAASPPQPVNESWRDAKEACGSIGGGGSGAERYLGHGVDCVIRIFSLDPLAPSIGKVVAGSGQAVGVASNLKVFPSDLWENTWSSQVRGSASGFWIAHSQLEMQRHVFDGANYNPNITVSATYWNLPQMAFYGIGPDTAKQDPAPYFTQREFFGGVSANFPWKIQSETNDRTGDTRYHGALVFGGAIEFRAPTIGEGTLAPGVVPAGSDRFVRTEGSLTYRREITDPNTILQMTFDDYRDIDNGGRYTFQRVETSADQVIFSVPTAGRLFVHGRVATSLTGSGSEAPFYYQQTLGGSDINGVDTLRGYLDYRFRAPNLWLTQLTYEKAVAVSIKRQSGTTVTFDIVPSVFDDIGDVAATRSDLFAHAKNTFGVGLALRAGNRTLARAYLGFGSEEKPHFFLDFTSLAFQ